MTHETLFLGMFTGSTGGTSRSFFLGSNILIIIQKLQWIGKFSKFSFMVFFMWIIVLHIKYLVVKALLKMSSANIKAEFKSAKLMIN